MQHLLFTPQVESSYRAAILIKETSFRRDALEAFYVRPLAKQGVSEKDLIAFSLKYQPDGKAPAAYCLEYLNQLLPALDSFGVTTVMVADNSYFKKLTGLTKTGSYYGYVVPCKVKGFEHINVVLCPNHSAVFHNPAMEQKIDMAIKTLAEHCQGTHVELGTEIINYEYYPKKVSSIAQVLQSLHAYPVLSADIEAFSLKHWSAGIGTISFAWDQHNGIAFPCDYEPLPEPVVAEDKAIHYGKQVINHEVRLLLREFFESYRGRLIWHNMAYDAKVIIYSLWMDHVRDYPGLLKGMEFMTRNGYEDTKIIAYLATNSCAGNNLGLKDQAHEFAGNYAQEDIDDIRLIPLDNLLKYNLVDSLATWYVHDKHRQTVIDDQQEELYQGLMKKSIKMLLQVELTGMPLNMKKVAFARRELEKEIAEARAIVDSSSVVADFEVMFRKHKWEMDYRKRRDKAKHPENIKYKDLSHFDTESFNPNSNPQLQSILYEILELPVLDYTKKKQPATGAETLEKLINHTSDPDIKDFLANLITFFAADKILGTFITAFEQNSVEHDGWHYLFGNFNLGGTVSGRLSSSGPNLQNMPSKGKYGKLIKDCFEAPPGWLWCGADFALINGAFTQ